MRNFRRVLLICVGLAIAICASWGGWLILQRPDNAPEAVDQASEQKLSGLRGMIEHEPRELEFYLEGLTDQPEILTKGYFALDWQNHPEGEWWPAMEAVRLKSDAEWASLYGPSPPEEMRQRFKSGWATYSFTTSLGTIGKQLPVAWVICIDPAQSDNNSEGKSVTAVADCISDGNPPREIQLARHAARPQTWMELAQQAAVDREGED